MGYTPDIQARIDKATVDARRAGYDEQEIKTAIVKRFGSEPTRFQGQKMRADQGLVKNILTGIKESVAQPARLIGGAGYELGRAISGAVGRPMAQQNPFLREEQLANPMAETGRALANIASFIPIGGGVSAVGKVGKFVPGTAQLAKTLGKGGVKKLAMGGALGAGFGEAGLEDSSVESILKAAAFGGVTGGVLGKLGQSKSLIRQTGKKAEKIGEDLATRSFRFSPTQKTKFETKVLRGRSSMGKFIQQENLAGKSSDDIRRTVIDPLQGEFDKRVIESGKTVKPQRVFHEFDTSINKLEDAGAMNSPQGRKLINYMKDEKEIFSKMHGARDSIPISEITQIRRQLDKAIPDARFADPVLDSQSRAHADVFRKIQSDVGGTRKIGQRLSKLRSFEKIARQQENLGTGTGLTPLRSTMAANAGGVSGFVAATAANAPGVQSLVGKGLVKGGQKLQQAGVKEAGQQIPIPLLQALGRTGGQVSTQGVSRQTPQQLQEQQRRFEETGERDGQIFRGAGLPGTTAQANIFTPQVIQQMVMHDLQTTGGKNLSKITAIQKLVGTTEGKKGVQSQMDMKFALAKGAARDALKIIETTPDLKTGELGTRIDIAKGKILGKATPTSGFRAQVGWVRSMIQSIISGAALSPIEMESLRPSVPQDLDSPALIKQKMETLVKRLDDIQQARGGSIRDEAITGEQSLINTASGL